MKRSTRLALDRAFAVVLFVVLASLVAVGIGTLVTGCGGAAQQHSALDRIADVVEPSFVLAIDACDEAEGAVIARTGTTYEADAAAIAEIRGVCDRVFGAFDAVRIAHETARAAVDGGGAALITAAMARLGEAWAALQAIAPEISSLGTGGR